MSESEMRVKVWLVARRSFWVRSLVNWREPAVSFIICVGLSVHISWFVSEGSFVKFCVGDFMKIRWKNLNFISIKQKYLYFVLRPQCVLLWPGTLIEHKPLFCSEVVPGS